ncbi:MAG TPA: hypothetical protein VMC08_06705 [Bacteroidales bacterium]|nr:hypothetical protein [Bacteroidales bacterium]
MKKIFWITGMLASVLAFSSGCYYDNEEDLYPQTTCDTTHVTYSGSVVPILQSNCYVCHSTALANGGVILDTYVGVQVVVQNGKLWGAINHFNGFYPMPKDSPKLPDCNITVIKKWIDAGSPDN